ncbi:hypothetical protein [Neobacillus sp. LXY-1]
MRAEKFGKKEKKWPCVVGIILLVLLVGIVSIQILYINSYPMQ